jgi:hypothetical protein
MDQHLFPKLNQAQDQDTHSLKKLDTDPNPHKVNADPKHCPKPSDVAP